MDAGGRHRDVWNALLKAVGDSPGTLAPEIRRSLIDGRAQTGALGAFGVKVSQNAASITDESVQKLLQEGQEEDAVFETVIASALGAANTRLVAGLRALEGKR